MKIGLDFDGVITNCGKLRSDAGKKLYGIDVSPDLFRRDYVVEKGLLTHEQYDDFQQKIYGTRDIGLLMEPVEDAFHYIKLLQKERHHVSVVTSRGEVELGIAKEWSRKHRLSLNIIGVGQKNSKAKALTGFDVFIDDNLDKLIQLIGYVNHRFLFSWGYNHDEEETGIATRIASWKEFYTSIQTLSDGR